MSHRQARPREPSPSASSNGSDASPNNPWLSDSSEDDVPLAQSIPTALSAQKSIRKKVREERVERKKARQASANNSNSPSHLRPLPGRSMEKAINDSMQAYQQHIFPPPALQQQLAATQARQRSKSLSSGTRPMLSGGLGTVPPIPRVGPHAHKAHSQAPVKDNSSPNDDERQSRQSSASGPTPSNRQRAASVSRSQSTASRRRPHGELVPPVPSSRRQSEESRRPSTSSSGHAPIVPPPPGVLSHGHAKPRAPPESIAVDDKMIKALMSGNPDKVSELRRARSLASSKLKQSEVTIAPAAPPVPPVRPPAVLEGSCQTRVFIGDLQRYQTLSITPTMTGGELISFLENQGVFKGWVGMGQWVLFEHVLDSRMERPVRPFETLSSITAGWGKGCNGTFLVRMHDSYGLLLPMSRIPEAGPVFKGWVEWEIKKGRWSKRWLELKEHGIWVAKKDGAKPELLCSLSAYDVYTLSPSTSSPLNHKAPKPFVFTLKSVDSLSFFEDTSDYMHNFCCKEVEGGKWVENILLARSYILHQERNVLSSGSNNSDHGRRAAGSTRPNKYLVADSTHTNAVFEPGSLLRTMGGGI